jgi:beta-lactamase class D
MQHALRSVIIIAAVANSACAPAAPPAHSAVAVSRERPEWARFFDEWNVVGTFVLHDERTGTTHRYDEARAAQRFIPASTFKIFNSMAALDAGAVRDIDEVIAWDGVVRNNEAWDRDQRMREAFQRSAVWFYQELARRVGEARMRDLLQREGYGNRSTEGGIDQFWLTGGLRISADEQVDFLRRLRRRELGFSPRAMGAVEQILVMERGADAQGAWVLRGKTGWARSEGSQTGWLVGWLDRGDDAWFYAMNLESDDAAFPMFAARAAIVRGVLAHAGLLEPAGR